MNMKVYEVVVYVKYREFTVFVAEQHVKFSGNINEVIFKLYPKKDINKITVDGLITYHRELDDHVITGNRVRLTFLFKTKKKRLSVNLDRNNRGGIPYYMMLTKGKQDYGMRVPVENLIKIERIRRGVVLKS
jgi:hypothetical protein